MIIIITIDNTKQCNNKYQTKTISTIIIILIIIIVIVIVINTIISIYSIYNILYIYSTLYVACLIPWRRKHGPEPNILLVNAAASRLRSSPAWAAWAPGKMEVYPARNTGLVQTLGMKSLALWTPLGGSSDLVRGL